MSNPALAFESLWNYRHLAERFSVGLLEPGELNTRTLVQRILFAASQTQGLSLDVIASNPIEAITQALMNLGGRGNVDLLKELTKMHERAFRTYSRRWVLGMSTKDEVFLRRSSNLILRTYFDLYPEGFYRSLFVDPYEDSLALTGQPYQIIGFVLPPGTVAPLTPGAGVEVGADVLLGMQEVVERQGGHCLVWN